MYKISCNYQENSSKMYNSINCICRIIVICITYSGNTDKEHSSEKQWKKEFSVFEIPIRIINVDIISGFLNF